MILDADLETVPLDRAVRVAIVGAGPAGMTLARELAGVAHVLLIEAGGLESEPTQQALLAGECIGLPYPLTETRARQFGGSSALWAGYCAMFDAHDFSFRSWVPGSGWPLGIESMRSYYARAAALLNLGEPYFDAREITRRAGLALPFDDHSVMPSVWRFGAPTIRFGEHLRQEFHSSSDLTTLIHASVVDITLDASHGTVTGLGLRTLGGREGHVSADVFVLACGGIETARLLLNSDRQVGTGVGNTTGLVGRCFMEHPHRAIEPFVLHDPGTFDGWTRPARFEAGGEFIPCIGLPPQAQAQARILNARAHVYRTPAMRPDEAPRIGLFIEQAPNPQSRVVLSDQIDSLGMRRVRLDWQLTELDRRTYECTAAAVAREFERLGAGRLNGAIETRDHGGILHSNHHLGTTRMSATREDGVVDADCRVQDLGNLYIVGGSVFPTVSWANPTLTVLALTFRLGDHLRRQLGAKLSGPRVASP